MLAWADAANAPRRPAERDEAVRACHVALSVQGIAQDDEQELRRRTGGRQGSSSWTQRPATPSTPSSASHPSLTPVHPPAHRGAAERGKPGEARLVALLQRGLRHMVRRRGGENERRTRFGERVVRMAVPPMPRLGHALHLHCNSHSALRLRGAHIVDVADGGKQLPAQVAAQRGGHRRQRPQAGLRG